MSKDFFSELKKRRNKVLSEIKGGVAILPGQSDTGLYGSFRQDSNFYYLSGLTEVDSLILLDPQSDKPYKIFLLPRDREKELWDGPRIGLEGAKEIFGADESFDSNDKILMEQKVSEALIHADKVYYSFGKEASFDSFLIKLFKKTLSKLGRTGRQNWPIYDLAQVIGELRVIKSPLEIETLKKACFISASSHKELMSEAKPNLFEYELESLFSHLTKLAGAERLAYSSIIASGENACVLHYRSNSRKIKNEELILIDAGCEYQYYASDITRTFPVTGAFSKEQREIYLAVLSAQKEAISLVKPGTTLNQIHTRASEVIAEELIKLKVLKGTVSSVMKNNSYREYFPHRTSHYLGLDVHDTGLYFTGPQFKQEQKLEEGMVFTIEPGLYFRKDSHCPDRYKDIGVRIEDDILVTKKGCEVLTSHAPKEIEEVEKACQK